MRRPFDDEKLFSPLRQTSTCPSFSKYILNPMLYLPKRILYSFLPPVWRFKGNGAKSTYIYIDVLGPVLGIALLISLLEYGYSRKTVRPKEVVDNDLSIVNVTTEVLIYFLGMSMFVYLTSLVDRCKLHFLEVTTMIGYSSYGCALTLGLPYFIDSTNDDLFMVSLVIGGGSCGLRILMSLLTAIQIPVARLLICSFVGSGHSLFLIYLYYMYMHSTFSFYVNH